MNLINRSHKSKEKQAYVGYKTDSYFLIVAEVNRDIKLLKPGKNVQKLKNQNDITQYSKNRKMVVYYL